MAKIGIVSLGCPRNLVDSEVMLGILKSRGHTVTDEIQGSDIVVVNTCAFIRDAVCESLDVILELINLKKKGKIRYIVVAGCLPQRYNTELEKRFNEIDGFIGTGDLANIDSVVEYLLASGRPYIGINRYKNKRISVISENPSFIYSHKYRRYPVTSRHSVYIKIQEGCANKCSYCIIPKIRGNFRSRPIESILKEVDSLAQNGRIPELNIVGQDTTFYGYDLYRRFCIAELLRSIAKLDKATWIRLLYTHPAHYTEDLIKIIKTEDSICKYLDIPIQHISDKILRLMNRNTTSYSIRCLIERLRRHIPNVALRTTVLIGFPGETDSDFMKLLHFIEDVKFERLGAFIYSNEKGSRSFHYKRQVPEKIKKKRFDVLMKRQMEISRDYNASFLNKKINVLIDERDEKDDTLFYGRTEFDAPSVDGEVIVKAKNLKIGDFVKVNITDTLEYDLVGEVS